MGRCGSTLHPSITSLQLCIQCEEHRKRCYWKKSRRAGVRRQTLHGGGARHHPLSMEAAQMAIYAEVLGGAKPIPSEMLKATVRP